MFCWNLTYDEWKCILSKTQKIHNFDNELIKGFVSLIEIEKVTEPQIWRIDEKNIPVCMEGYKWLTILPREEKYCITTMMNDKSEIILWYIDIIADQGIDGDGAPYYDDLYLDLIVYPNGIVIEDDRDELEQAWKDKDISTEQLELANETCDELKSKLQDIDSFIAYTYNCMKFLED